MKEKLCLSILLILISFFLLFQKNVNAVENIFYVDTAGYQFSGPSNIVSLDDGLSMAVINRLSKKISKIKHGQIVMERAIDNFEPFAMAAVNGQLFISSNKSGEVKVLSQIDLSTIETIPVSKSTTYMAVSSDRTKIFVASPIRTGDTIGIIDIASKSILSPPIFATELNLVNRLATRNGKLFASCIGSTSIAIYDEMTGSNLAKANFKFSPDDIAVTDSYLYLSSKNYHMIQIVDIQSLEVVKEIPFTNGSPYRMVYDEKKYIYVLNNDKDGKVFKLNIETNEFDDSSCFSSGECFYTGANPDDAVISRDRKVLYITNYSDNSVSWHSILGKLFVEPRTIIVKPSDSSTDNGSNNAVVLKAGGGSGNYRWSALHGKISPASDSSGHIEIVTGDEAIFTPPSNEDVYYVTVEDENGTDFENAQIIVVDIRVTPEHVTLADQTPHVFNITGGTPPYEITALEGGTLVHNKGESDFIFTPPDKDGIYVIEIKDKNNTPLYAKVELATEGVPIIPADASRAAIIVAGGPPDDPLWPGVEAAAEKLYDILKNKKKFSNDEIYFLSPIDIDVTDDGIPDSIIRNKQGNIEEKNIKEAFEWAGKLTKLDQPLFVFLLGHGEIDKFHLNLGVSSLKADDLKKYLDEYQKNSGREVVIIIDSCHSGSFIDNIAGTGRAVITSTGEENSAYYLSQERTSSSFIYNFSVAVDQRRNLLESYDEACNDIKVFYSNQCLGQYNNRQILFQNPQFDDNGDGNYYDKFMNKETDDGTKLKTIYINPPPPSNNRTRNRLNFNRFENDENFIESEQSTFPLDNTLSVVSLNSSISVENVENIVIGSEIELKANVGFAKDSLKGVYGILKPPGMKITFDKNGIPHPTYPLIKLFKSNEIVNMESYNSQIWSTKWKDAVYNGCYEITFYALSANGSVAFSEPAKFSVYDAESPPENPSIDIVFNGQNNSNNISLNEYSNGDNLTISFIERLNWGYDLYAALVMPDSNWLIFSGLNKISLFTGTEDSILKWQENRSQKEKVVMLDIPISDNIPKGTYQVYLIMSPQDINVFNASGYWVVSVSEFSIK